MFFFNENSGLVEIWVRLIKRGEQTLDKVPDISNLREVVERKLQED